MFIAPSPLASDWKSRSGTYKAAMFWAVKGCKDDVDKTRSVSNVGMAMTTVVCNRSSELFFIDDSGVGDVAKTLQNSCFL